MRDTQFGRCGFQRGGHDRGVIQRARAPRARPIAQPADTRAVIACPPSDHRRPRSPHPRRDFGVRHPSAASSTIGARCANPPTPTTLASAPPIFRVPVAQTQRRNSHLQLSQTTLSNNFRHTAAVSLRNPHPNRAFHVAHPLDHRSPVGAIANVGGACTTTKCGARRLSMISPLSEDRYVGTTVTATPESAGDDPSQCNRKNRIQMMPASVDTHFSHWFVTQWFVDALDSSRPAPTAHRREPDEVVS